MCDSTKVQVVQMMNEVVMELSRSSEPSLRYKINIHVFGKSPRSKIVTRTQQEVRVSERVKALLSGRDAQGRIPHHPEANWFGAHWVLESLADQGYPPGDASLEPLREQVHEWLFSEERRDEIQAVDGRARVRASHEGNALYYLLTLGLADDRTDKLAERLMTWQWEDGGWNGDARPGIVDSSFSETLISLRGLALYNSVIGDIRARKSVNRAAELLFSRKLYKNESDGSPIEEGFVKLHYPRYSHYDVLFALKVMTDAGFIEDERCEDALDWLVSKKLPGGGFPADALFYTVSDQALVGSSRVDWGGAGPELMNPFVTADALHVLREARRL